jgi:LmbE family N-acetylglucosaminyl deacetylase
MRVTRLLLVAAHPDDEVLGAGAQLPQMYGLRLIHVTDGAPRNLSDARAAGFATPLVEIFLEHQAEVVLSHPYEGGHPDHDATAFAVHAACRLMARRVGGSPRIVEFACYHAGEGSLRTGEFLPGSEVPEEPL